MPCGWRGVHNPVFVCACGDPGGREGVGLPSCGVGVEGGDIRTDWLLWKERKGERQREAACTLNKDSHRLRQSINIDKLNILKLDIFSYIHVYIYMYVPE